jgi:hypothetical protein
MRREDMVASTPKKVIRCYCGFVTDGDDEQLIISVQAHAREVHSTEYTANEVLAMAELVG